MRKVYSSPKSKEQALKYRSSKKWKVADATFKLMDKFGYLAILKQYKEALEKVDTGDGDLSAEAAQLVLDAAKEYINNDEKLAEEEGQETFESIVTKTAKIVESFTRKYTALLHKKKAIYESKEADEQYVKDFKDFFGYKDDYMPEKSYHKKMDSLAAECALRMPTDTAAREIEGDAVMLLVLSGEEEAVKAGKKLGDCMMKKGKHDQETLLKRMSDAYKALQDLWAKYERDAEEKRQLVAEAVKTAFKGKVMLVSEDWDPEYDDKPVN